MKRNNFGKLLAIAMIFAGFSLTSCDKNDNAIIDGEVFEPSTVKKVDGGAVVSASTPAEVSRMISRLRKEIVEAAENNETYTINIDATALNATATDNIISLLTVNNSDLVVNFTGAITTDEPLVLQSKGVDEDTPSANPASSKVAINLPGGTSDIDLQVNMPTASVTLKPTSGSLSINELSTKTAWETLNIEGDVTIDLLQNMGGYVVMKDGGKINSIIVEDQDLLVDEKGIRIPNVYNDSIRQTTDYTEDDYVYAQSARINKNESKNLSLIFILPSKKLAQEIIPEIILSDGVYAWVNKGGTGDSEEKFPYVNITGEGNATMMPNGGDWGSGPSLWCPTRLELDCIYNLTNVTVDYSKYLKFDNETWSGKYNIAELGNDYFIDRGSTSEISLPVNSENCTFKAMKIHCSGDMFMFSEDIVLSTHKGSTFDNLKSEDKPFFITHYPGQSEKRKTFIVAFDACGFVQACFGTEYTGHTGVEYKDFKGYMLFDNSKAGGKAITKDTDMVYYDWHPEGSATTYTIDGADYEPVFNAETGKYILKAIDAE